MPHPSDLDATRQGAQAALLALLSFGAVMLATALTGLQPSPPADKLPIVATSLALGVAAFWLLAVRHAAAGTVSLLAALAWVPTVGVHKFLLEPHALLLTPVLLVGSACVVVLVAAGLRLRPRKGGAPAQAQAARVAP